MFTQHRPSIRMLTVGTLAGALICGAGSVAPLDRPR